MMSEPYNKYDAAAERASVPRSNFPGYFSSEAATPYYAPESTEFRGVSSDFVKREVTPSWSGLYSVDDVSGIGACTAPSVNGLGDGGGVRPAPKIGGVTAGSGGMVYPPPTEDPNYFGQRRDVSVGVPSTVPDMVKDRLHPLTNAGGPAVSKGDSNILSVDGLPTDCTRREVGHLFRPFIGYKDIKVIHKEPRHSGGRATVFCFVEFVDAKCAVTAMEALRGYKFDDKKPDSPALRIQYAHFPFRPPSYHEGQRISVPY